MIIHAETPCQPRNRDRSSNGVPTKSTPACPFVVLDRNNGDAAVIKVLINTMPVELPEGSSVLHALRAAGIHLPALCHDDRIAPSGSCRSCLVQVDGAAKPVTACTTHLEDGMEIETHTPALEEARRGILEMLVRRYPAPAISQFPDKPFHLEILEAGLADRASTAVPDVERQDHSHPYIAVDLGRCIDCYRCVRICAELQGQFVWHVRERGLGTLIRPDGPNLRDSSCVACGACVDTCPTGALEDKTRSTLEPPSQWTRTTCPYCGVGCELTVGTRGGRMFLVRPVQDAPVSKGHLCVKGRYAFGFVSAADRITQPMIRDGSAWRRVSWNEARAFVADRLHAVIRRDGPDSIGILGSARATNEENYLAQKLARVVIGTNNVDCCARVCHAPSAAALKGAFGAGLATNSFDDIEHARAILVCGANATEDHPIVGARIKQAALRGARLIVLDPRRIELAHYADCHLALKPGTNVALLNAMAHTIVAEGLCNREFLQDRTSGFDGFERFIERWSPERAAGICGLEPASIRRAARLYATGAPAMSVHGLGLTEHMQGTDGVTALINLALLTGNVGRPGTGVNPLRGQNNVQGAAHMGCDPGVLPGSVALDEGRAACETHWNGRVPAIRGLHLLDMLDAARAGRLKALWAIGYDVLLTNPNATETLRALQSLELVIVQDMFLTVTARECGTVFLPACSSFEKDGTFMNAERRIQRVRAALRPRGASKPDWQILCEIARAMGGRGFSFEDPEEIWNEVRALCLGARGMSYARLEEGGLQWPCPDEQHPGTPILHRERFAHGPRAPLQPVEYRDTPEVVTPEYPFLLVTGRSLYQFNAGTMTGRTANNELRSSDVLDMSPVDAARLALHDDEVVRVRSRYGSATLPVRITSAVLAGQLFATFQTPDVFINALTGPFRDTWVGTPEYKVTAVHVEAMNHPLM
jgi:formate dehydrogenase major subunit